MKLWELLGLMMPAVYRTVPWWTQTATSGGRRMADGGAKPDRSLNAADLYPVKIGGETQILS